VGLARRHQLQRLARCWRASEKKVVVVDFDVGLRNLDLVMGAERRVVFDLINVVQGTIKLSQALIRDKRLDTLYLLPASQTRDKDALTEEGVAGVIAELRTRFDPARAASGEMLRIADVLEILSIPLLGIVPESKDVLRASNIGSPITICGEPSAAARAYMEAARRFSGESVAMTMPNNRKGLLNRLFGRRAA
jgi:septum site-determining protein MinD